MYGNKGRSIRTVRKTQEDTQLQLQLPIPKVGAYVEVQRQFPMFQRVQKSMSLVGGPCNFVAHTRSTSSSLKPKSCLLSGFAVAHNVSPPYEAGDERCLRSVGVLGLCERPGFIQESRLKATLAVSPLRCRVPSGTRCFHSLFRSGIGMKRRPASQGSFRARPTPASSHLLYISILEPIQVFPVFAGLLSRRRPVSKSHFFVQAAATSWLQSCSLFSSPSQPDPLFDQARDPS